MTAALVRGDEVLRGVIMENPLKVFPGSASRKLTAAICERLSIPVGECETIRFSEGNIFVRVLENVRGADCFVVQATGAPVNDNFMELLFWIDALKRASASGVTAVVPFFSYAKGDKKDEPRVSIRARVCADMIEAAGADRVLTMDLHAPQIQGFFKIPVDHLYAMTALCERVRELVGRDVVVVSPDVGFGKQARKYGTLLDASVAIGDKYRSGHDERPAVLHVIGEVREKTAVIVDDFVTTGGSMVEMAEALLELGVKRVLGAATHGVMSEGAAERLDRSPIEKLLITDTVESHAESLSGKVEVVSVAGLFAEAVKSIHERTSISKLFPEEIQH